MQNLLSERIKNMAVSATLAMAAKSRELQAKGIDVIPLSLGEPDFGTPDFIREAAKKAIDDGYSKYTPVPGYPELRNAICNKFKRDNNLDYTPDQIVVSTGAKQTLANLAMCLINPGDEVIMPIPYWVSYEAQIELAGGIVVGVPTTIENDFKMTPDQLRAVINNKTKAFIFSSPCNPSGSVYTKEELDGLAEVFAEYPDVIIIADEIYELINFTGKHASIGTIPSLKDRTVTVNGLSKGFAMTGWRLGYMGAPLAIAKACSKMQGQFTSGTCAVTQRAAIEALGDNLEPSLKMKQAFLERRNMVYDLLNDIDGLQVNMPQGAFYFFPNAKSFIGKSYEGGKINSIDDLAMYILNVGHVAVVTGSAFGDNECFRLSYATSEDKLKEALRRIKECLSNLS